MRKAQSGTRTSGTILIVDDATDSLFSVQRLLERQGYHVMTARDGREALAALDQSPVQVALVDYLMPEMSGPELIREMRHRHPFLQVILHTAYCNSRAAHSLLKELGIQGLHDKSEGPDKLLLWVQAALKHHRDIERLQNHERTHRDLIAHASHELKNPLQVISGYGESLLSGAAGPLTERAKPIVRAIAGQAHCLTEMTSNILLYSRLLSEGMESGPRREVELHTLVRDVPELAHLFLAEKTVTFTLDMPNPSLSIETDAEKVRIILHNLLSNAAKFTEHGSIYFGATVHGSEVRFVVRDSGIGIAAEHLEDIFEPFWQACPSQPRDLGGIGLGLTVSRRLASLLGGSLRVSSQLGAGSTFTLKLPASLAEPSRPQTDAIEPGDIRKSRSPFGFFRPF